MEKVTKKFTALYTALTTLSDSIDLFLECKETANNNPTPRNEKFALGMRDSMIQRFEYCTDLFWKVLKFYLEEVEKISVGVVSPRSVVRAAVTARIITEDEGQQCMKMIENRNKTSHMYHAEIAQDIAQDVPAFHHLIKTITDKIAKKTAAS
jgi:nucleotidyltransferase substrate binding protein (TIGR01987 family)